MKSFVSLYLIYIHGNKPWIYELASWPGSQNSTVSYPYRCSDCISPNLRPAHCGPGMLAFSRRLTPADPSSWNTLPPVIQCLAPGYSESLSLTPAS